MCTLPDSLQSQCTKDIVPTINRILYALVISMNRSISKVFKGIGVIRTRRRAFIYSRRAPHLTLLCPALDR